MVDRVGDTMIKTDEAADVVLESLSAFIDGELATPQQDELMRAIRAGNSLRADWCTYHCIGDVLRSDETAFVSLTFEQRFKARLEQEPHLLALEAATINHGASGEYPPRKWRTPVSYAAGIAAIALVGFVAVGQRTVEMPQSAQVAPVPMTALSQPAQVAAAEPAARPVSNEYLQAHRNYSVGLAMRGVVSHVRTVGHDQK